MSTISSKDLELLNLSTIWAKNNELQGAFIVVQALWKKYPNHFELFFRFINLYEQLDPIQAFTLLSDVLSGDEKWQDFLYPLKNEERSLLFEKHGLLALKLKDELAATESLKRAASLGRDTLPLWGTLSYLLALGKDIHLSTKSLCRALELYKEPSLFEDESQKFINEDLFLHVCLTLFPQIAPKEVTKLFLLVKNTFPNRPWLVELQDIVAKVNVKMPIALSGDHNASADKKNW